MPVHFSIGSLCSSPCAMQRQKGNGSVVALPVVGKSAVARGSQRGDVGGAQIVKRFVERFRIDIAVGRVRADVAKVSIAGKRQIAGRVCAAGSD